ncbi:MAG: DUF480 domain-containing protein [Pirellulales bacterium]
MSDSAPAMHEHSAPRWKPLPAIDRRVLGVLAEKAKTTPEAYPLSINALRSGCNQKSNRFPSMELELEDIEESLERLRGFGAVVEVQGGGRVARFRHCLYDWLGVDKVELAVMAELLLRGTQTEGELRGRAARMEPIADLAALRPVLASLKQKKLVISLSPEGRGHVVTHGLYEPRELEKQRAEAAAGIPADHDSPSTSPPAPRSEASGAQASGSSAAIDALRREMDELRGELQTLRAELCG